MALQWVAADFRTGRLIADLPSFEPAWPLRNTISNFDAAQGTLQMDGAPQNWQRATTPLATVLACYDDTDPTHPIQWAGYVALRDPLGDSVDVSLSTAEGYLNRRFVTDVTYNEGRNLIFRDLVSQYVVGGVSPIPGWASLIVSHSGDGPAPTTPLVWQNTDNATVFSRMQQLCEQFGGEFAIQWEWSTDRESLVPTLFVGDRIGQAAPAGQSPAVTFDYPGAVTSFGQPEDYTEGQGANVVTMFSTGQGSVTPYSAPQILADPGDRITVELRDSPQVSAADQAALDQYAAQRLIIAGPGARPTSLVLARAACQPDPITGKLSGRQFGVDWRLGDDIGYRVADTVPSFPGGLEGVGRPVAVEQDLNTVTPVFADSATYAGAV